MKHIITTIIIVFTSYQTAFSQAKPEKYYDVNFNEIT